LLRIFVRRGGIGEQIFDDHNVAQGIAMAGVGAVAADFAPARCLAEAQAVAIFG
jgi:hypothetical protein